MKNKETSGVNGKEELKLIGIAFLVIILFITVLFLLLGMDARQPVKNSVIRHNTCYRYLDNY